MEMEFNQYEVIAILKAHVVEKMGVPEELVGDVFFMGSVDHGNVRLWNAKVEVDSESTGDPYRTKGRAR